MKTFVVCHLVKSEDLNHHGTLFAGRMAEWFVESTFIAAASMYGNSNNIVCVKIHGMKFSIPTNKGDIIKMETKVVLVGTTSITVYGRVQKVNGVNTIVEGFVTFVCVDEEGKKIIHNLQQPEPQTQEEVQLMEIAKGLK